MGRKTVEDLTGLVSSRLTVLSRAPDRFTPNGKRRIYWNCVCECGTHLEVRSDALRTGASKSCGCLTREVAYEQIKKAQAVGYKRTPQDLTGRVFGRLTVREPAERSVTPKGRELPRWWCDCSCGGEINTLHDSLLQGKVSTCGCVPSGYALTEYRNKTDVFIDKAKAVHGEKYDYSLTEFIHSKVDVVITCPKHGAFKQNPANHLFGSGCAKCSPVGSSSRGKFICVDETAVCEKHGPYSLLEGCEGCLEEDSQTRIENYIKECEVIHEGKYDYSKVFFENRKEYIDIICKEHGEFRQQASSHISGRGCPECGRISKLIGLDAFIERSREVHGDRYDYSLVDYKRSDEVVDIICPHHGIFQQKPYAHINGQKCIKCSGEERAAKQHWNYIKRCELNPQLAESPAVLYLLEFNVQGEEFLKVGITSNYIKRLGHYREYGIHYTEISKIEGIAKEIAIAERDILREIRREGYKYIPQFDFKGWTECATLDSKDFILELFSRYS